MPLGIEPKTYETDEEKRRDFRNGFSGWWMIHLLLLEGMRGASGWDGFYVVLILNIVGLICLAFTRKWMAFGALAALGAALLIALLFVAACFSVMDSSF